MKIDNFENIKTILQFKPGKYAFITIYQRKKDNPTLTEQMHAVKHYYIDSYKSLDKVKNEIITLCETFNARAYITYSLRDKSNFIPNILSELSNVAKCDMNRLNFEKLAATSGNILRTTKPNRNDGYLMIDVDSEYGKEILPSFMNVLQSCDAENIITLPSVTGIHVLIDKINTYKLKNVFDKMNDKFHEHFEIKGRDAYTLLYANLK